MLAFAQQMLFLPLPAEEIRHFSGTVWLKTQPMDFLNLPHSEFKVL